MLKEPETNQLFNYYLPSWKIAIDSNLKLKLWRIVIRTWLTFVFLIINDQKPFQFTKQKKGGRFLLDWEYMKWEREKATGFALHWLDDLSFQVIPFNWTRAHAAVFVKLLFFD